LRLFSKLPLKNAAILRRCFSELELETGGKFAIILSKLITTGASARVNKRSDRFEAGGNFAIRFFKLLAKRSSLAKKAITSSSR